MAPSEAGDFRRIERAIHDAMDCIHARIAETHQRIAASRRLVPDRVERAERVPAAMRCAPFEITPALLAGSRDRLRRSKKAIAMSRALIDAAKRR